jgi:hypothetical protein
MMNDIIYLFDYILQVIGDDNDTVEQLKATPRDHGSRGTA